MPLNMKQDLLDEGKKILVAGDLDQLSPVADNPAFLADGRIYILDEIMRQFKGSAIIYLCQRAKHGLPIHTGIYGNEVMVLEEKDFSEIAPKVLPRAGVVLCGKNETRDKYTNYIRHDLLGKISDIPTQGEKVICRINNWNREANGINLTNGLNGIVMNQPDVSRFDGRCFNIDFLPDLSPVPFYDIPVDHEYFVADTQKRRTMKECNYVVGEGFEFGYVETVHIAQGSQWKTGIYLEEFLKGDNNRLHYTALSRFSNKCIYVKKNRKYY